MKDPEYFRQEADRRNMGEERVDDAWRIETAKHPAPTVTARLLIISLSMLNTNQLRASQALSRCASPPANLEWGRTP